MNKIRALVTDEILRTVWLKTTFSFVQIADEENFCGLFQV